MAAGCARGDDGTGASASEAQQLNDAAASLEADSQPVNAADAPGNQASEEQE